MVLQQQQQQQQQQQKLGVPLFDVSPYVTSSLRIKKR